jgi:hypothetical protein
VTFCLVGRGSLRSTAYRQRLTATEAARNQGRPRASIEPRAVHSERMTRQEATAVAARRERLARNSDAVRRLSNADRSSSVRASTRENASPTCGGPPGRSRGSRFPSNASWCLRRLGLVGHRRRGDGQVRISLNWPRQSARNGHPGSGFWPPPRRPVGIGNPDSVTPPPRDTRGSARRADPVGEHRAG